MRSINKAATINPVGFSLQKFRAMLSTLQNKLQNKLKGTLPRATSELQYRLDLAHHRNRLPALSAADQQIADALDRDGVCITTLEALGIPSTPTLLKASHRYLQDMKAVLAADPTKQDNFGSVLNPAYPQIFTVTDLPEFSAWGYEPRLLNIVENYVKVPIKYQGVHLRRDFSNENPVTTELWHRDLEDRRMVKIFVYLTEATDEYGPLEYIPKSRVSYWLDRHIQKKIARAGRMGLTDAEMDEIIPRSEWRRCSVPVGSVVFADPIAVFHHGKSRLKDRAALFFVYTAAKPLRPECVLQYSDETFARPKHIS
jgi:Phytanoyl-CoA dioxygenase (PhyH)